MEGAAAGVNLEEQLMVGVWGRRDGRVLERLKEEKQVSGGRQPERGRCYCTHMKDTMYIYSNATSPVQAGRRSDVYEADLNDFTGLFHLVFVHCWSGCWFARREDAFVSSAHTWNKETVRAFC